MARAVALISGGLDSTLAAWVMKDQGVEVHGLTGLSIFHPGFHRGLTHPGAEAAAQFLGIPLKTIDTTEALLAMVKHPKHGLGGHLNPCIDCRIYLLQQAKQYLSEIGGDFIVTGEVLGQRPMSQRRDPMRTVAREAGVEGIVVRPLCAKMLEPTIPEQQGLIDREKLHDVHGRGRKPQMALARKIGLTDYPSPAGGCLLTDPGFSARMAELMAHCDPTAADVELLKVGRHFRLDDGSKVGVGRDELDNEHLDEMAVEGDALLELSGVTGPLTLLRGEASDANLEIAGALTARFSRAKQIPSARISIRPVGRAETAITVDPQLAASLKMIEPAGR